MKQADDYFIPFFEEEDDEDDLDGIPVFQDYPSLDDEEITMSDTVEKPVRESTNELLVGYAHRIKDGACTCGMENCPLPGNHSLVGKGWPTGLEHCTSRFTSRCRSLRLNVVLATGLANRILAFEIPSTDYRKYLDHLSRVGGVSLPDTFTLKRKNRAILLFSCNKRSDSVMNIGGVEGSNLHADESYIVLHPDEIERISRDELVDGSVLLALGGLWSHAMKESRNEYPLPKDYNASTSVDYMTEVLFPTPTQDEVIPGLARGEVGILAGEPGIETTWLSMSMAIWTSLGLPLFGGLLPACAEQRRIMFVTCEEGRERIKKRMAKLLRGGYTTDELKRIQQNVLIEVVKGTEWNEDLIDKDGFEDKNMRNWLISRAQGIDLLIVDPLARLIKVGEDNAAAATMAIEILEKIAQRAGCALIITHHVSKDGANWTGAIRWQVNTWKMGEIEKKEHALPDHKAIAVSVAKANNAETLGLIACYKYDREKILSFVRLLSTGTSDSSEEDLQEQKKQDGEIGG